MAKTEDGLSEDDSVINQQLFGEAKDAGVTRSEASMEKLRSETWELPPSKMGDNNNLRASPNGQQFVSNSIAVLSQVGTLVRYDPGRWSKPSFMEKKPTMGRSGGKLGGYAAELSGMRKGEVEPLAWLSWKELAKILEEI
jgi:hypothetical protein